MRKIGILAFVAFLAGCAELPSNRMCFDEVHYVESFPKTFDLQQAKSREELSVDTWSLAGFRIVDTLLIAVSNDSEGYWTFFSLPDMRPLGSFLRKGNGPGEFLSCPFLGDAAFRREADGLHAYLHDDALNRLFALNIDSTLRRGTAVLRLLSDSLPPQVFRSQYIGSDRWLLRVLSQDWKRMDRCFFENGRCETPPVLEPLNAAYISKADGASQNLIGAIIKYSPLHDRIVEAPVSFRYINIYAPDDSFARTISLTREIEDIDYLVEQGFYNFPCSFWRLELYDDFFAVLASANEETEMTLNDKSVAHPRVIRLFDWEGAPLAEIRSEQPITTFDFDPARGHLYIYSFYDADREEFCRYDVSDWLGRL